MFRNDEIACDEIAALKPDRICISPGPCSPPEAGISLHVLRRFSGQVPILGVCLGQQAIGHAFGGRVIRAKALMHGKTAPIEHTGVGVFAGLPSPFIATRYHSLAVEGVQFHPESIASEHGHELLKNFLNGGRA